MRAGGLPAQVGAGCGVDLSTVLHHAGTLAQVLLIDLTLAGDNAIVVGMAVIGMHGPERRRAIAIGTAGATVLRLLFALVAVKLIAIVGLTLAGGVLLLWVASRMYRELRVQRRAGMEVPPSPSFGGALFRIILADLSMSLDNVLAVAGAARQDIAALAVGLVVSVVLMGAAATMIARLIERFRWIAWVGLAIVLYVALRMVWDGSGEVLRQVAR